MQLGRDIAIGATRSNRNSNENFKFLMSDNVLLYCMHLHAICSHSIFFLIHCSYKISNPLSHLSLFSLFRQLRLILTALAKVSIDLLLEFRGKRTLSSQTDTSLILNQDLYGRSSLSFTTPSFTTPSFTSNLTSSNNPILLPSTYLILPNLGSQTITHTSIFYQ